MKTFLLWSVSIAFLVFTSLRPTYSQTIVPAGYVSGTWNVAGSPYLIMGDITVGTDSTLTIEPGVEVNFQGFYSFTVNGYLQAVGTETDSIHFFPANTTPGWNTMRFENAPDSSHLAYCTISYSGNTIFGMGGIICTNSNPVITHCRISDNGARSSFGGIAGGIALNSSHPEISWCDIRNNENPDYGGGIYISHSSPVITGCNISGNESVMYGGGIYITGNSSPIITSCTIEGNVSNWEGGGIYCAGGVTNFLECTIGYNESYLSGGGINSVAGNMFLNRCTIEHNQCSNWSAQGGGIFANGGTLTVDHCTFYGNYIENYGNYGLDIHTGGSVAMTVSNSIFYNDFLLIVFGSTSPASVSYNDFQNYYSLPFIGNIPAGLGQLTTTNANGDSCDVYSNLYLDPLFASPLIGDYQITWAHWPTPDTTKSPCIDAGDPLSPLDPDGTVADMGAFYFHQGGTGIPSGYVSGIWTAASSPYRILGDITIHADSTLTIEPGVEVIFQGHYRFIINGIINAVGTQTDSIRFTAAIPDTGWRGLRFMTSTGTSHLAYCTIEYGKATSGSILHDRRGGGIYCLNSLPEISHCSIRNNLADVYGGGICFYNVSNDTIFITDCDITNNKTTGFSGDGGGIYFAGTELFVEMQNCVVSHNVSTNGNGGGIYIGYLAATTNVLNLSNCNVTYNQAGNEGGGIWTEVWQWNRLYITGCNISYNTAVNNGGGIHTEATLTGGNYTGTYIYGSSFIGNEVTGALGKGGAIYGDLVPWPYITKTIEYTIFTDNQAFEGGGLYLFQSNAYFDKCTIANNTGTTGSGLYFPSSSNIHLKNSILSLNSPAVIHNEGILYLNYSDFYGNVINISGGVPAGFGQLVTTNYNGDSCDVGYNIFLDPLFVDFANRDYHLSWANWPTPDTTKSPCIDAGDPLSPFDPDGTIADMGVFSFDQPVPVELVSFTAELNENNVVLKWITATETNNYGFEIQRKLDNPDWEKTGFVEGHGTTTEIQEYSYKDDISNINENSITYRLKQIDFDGSYEYSKEVVVENITPLDFALYQNYPNPFNPVTTIKYSIPEMSKVSLILFNLLGEKVTTLFNEEKTAGNYTIELNAANLPSGIYFYKLQAGDFVETKKMILLK